MNPFVRYDSDNINIDVFINSDKLYLRLADSNIYLILNDRGSIEDSLKINCILPDNQLLFSNSFVIGDSLYFQIPMFALGTSEIGTNVCNYTESQEHRWFTRDSKNIYTVDFENNLLKLPKLHFKTNFERTQYEPINFLIVNQRMIYARFTDKDSLIIKESKINNQTYKRYSQKIVLNDKVLGIFLFDEETTILYNENKLYFVNRNANEYIDSLRISGSPTSLPHIFVFDERAYVISQDTFNIYFQILTD